MLASTIISIYIIMHKISSADPSGCLAGRAGKSRNNSRKLKTSFWLQPTGSRSGTTPSVS
jgi:hypothetical protein